MPTYDTVIDPLIRIVNAPHVSEHDVAVALGDSTFDAAFPEGPGLQLTVEGDGKALTVTARSSDGSREQIGRARDPDLRGALNTALARLAAERSHPDDQAPPQRRRDRGLPLLQNALQDVLYEERSSFDAIVHAHLGTLMRFVEQELEHLRAAGLLASDDPSAEDVIDDTLVRALEDLPYRTEVIPVSSWLTAHASQVLEHEVALARSRGRERLTGVSLPRLRRLHECAAGTAPGAPAASGEEASGSGESAVVTAATGPASPDTAEPEAMLAAEELRAYLVEALADLPTPWRRAVIFVHMDDQPLHAVAATLGAHITEVQAMLEHADAFLRARLTEHALALPEALSLADCLAWPTMPEGFAADLEADLKRVINHPD